LMKRKFYGKLVLSFEAGNIVNIHQDESLSLHIKQGECYL
jgi:hypothetical protein